MFLAVQGSAETLIRQGGKLYDLSTVYFLKTRLLPKVIKMQHILELQPKHTHTFNGPLSRTTWVSQYQIGKTNLVFIKARDSEWQ